MCGSASAAAQRPGREVMLCLPPALLEESSVPACADAVQLATAPHLARVSLAGYIPRHIFATPWYAWGQRLQQLLPNAVVSCPHERTAAGSCGHHAWQPPDWRPCEAAPLSQPRLPLPKAIFERSAVAVRRSVQAFEHVNGSTGRRWARELVQLRGAVPRLRLPDAAAASCLLRQWN